VQRLQEKGVTQTVLLVNSNIAKPPVSPVGLEYVGHSLVEAGIPVDILDLSFEADWQAAIRRELEHSEPLLVGLPVRNTDDCCFLSRRSFLPWISELVAELRKWTGAPVFLGGIGFSIMPDAVLQATQADGGIAGDGEQGAVALYKSLVQGKDLRDVPNMVYWLDGRVVRNPRIDIDLRHLPVPRRRLFDNRRYEELGALVGVETKRGCPERCVFCADPVAKGRRSRLRPPGIVVEELNDLVDQGVCWLHMCDSEFNLPIQHARDVCQAIIAAGLGDKLRWYCYCSPFPFDGELASLMMRAGCAGINFGVDSLCDEQLGRLGKSYSAGDVFRLVELLRDAGLNYMFDLLVGGPGETAATTRETIMRAREYDVPLVGISMGVRIWPGTPLAEAVASGVLSEGCHPDAVHDLSDPVFYLSPQLGSDPLSLVDELAGGDSRFLILSKPSEQQSYNYADDDDLARLIQAGARGAYWDIIRRYRRS